MKPSRTTQPYRRGARIGGPVLSSMLKGATASGSNPADVQRGLARMARARTGRRTTRARPLPKLPRLPPL